MTEEIKRYEDLTPEQLQQCLTYLDECINDLSPLFSAVLYGNPKVKNFFAIYMKCPNDKYNYRIILQRKDGILPPEKWDFNDDHFLANQFHFEKSTPPEHKTDGQWDG